VDNAYADVLSCPNAEFHSSLPDAQSKMIINIGSMIHRRILSTGTHPAMAQPHNDQGSNEEHFLLYIWKELLEQPNYSINHLSSVVAATETSM